MEAVQAYFRKRGRQPSDAELETVAQTWSEHCKHKTFRAAIDYVEKDVRGVETVRSYQDLLKETIVKVTDEVRRPFCLSVFKDNAGIVSYDGKTGLAFKVETHNHPSALEPFGGAGTGLGGVIRDVLGAGLGAKPIANTDVFCFGPLSDGTGSSGLSTRRVFHGVVSGVRDYGNPMGIPTVSGAVYFDEDFRDNPLVFCGSLGLIPVDAIDKDVCSGDRVVMVGGRVGRDGVHGATFSSDNLTTGIPASVVQIGNPIVEKKVQDVLLQARDRRLYRGITDCGAGGLSSAVGEMGEHTGVSVSLDRVPLKYEGLEPWEIWVSESQERMVLAVPPENLKALQELFASEDVEATDIGEFGGQGRLRVSHGGRVIVDMEMDFLHGGCPKRRMTAVWSPPTVEVFPSHSINLKQALLDILADPTVASKEWIIRQYDHEVQGRTILKPLVGVAGHGPSDAAVLQLNPSSPAGVAIACGLNPHYSRWDPYWMAASALDEAVRNVVAVGADPNGISLLDNFCGGDPTDSRILGELVRTAQACYDVARVYGTPFISGKDSLFNQFVDPATGGKRAIPTTLLISALAPVKNTARLVTMDFKRPGHWIYVLGQTHDELGGARYGLWRKSRGGVVPHLNPRGNWALYQKLYKAISQGWVAACHDCSEGGLAVALAEMAIAGRLGFQVDLKKLIRSMDVHETDHALFSESNGRFVVEVSSATRQKLVTLFKGLPISCIGQVKGNPRLKVVGLDGEKISWLLPEVEKAWLGGLKV
jgi:phosphoribosylformylglycinamidine synthase